MRERERESVCVGVVGGGVCVCVCEFMSLRIIVSVKQTNVTQTIQINYKNE